MLIYICCAGGMTSSFFCSKIEKSKGNRKIVFEEIEVALKNYEKLNEENDWIIAYGAADFIRESVIKKYKLEVVLDLVVLCPQVSYLEKKLQGLLKPYNIPVYKMNYRIFGNMNGEVAINEIERYINEIESEKIKSI